MDVPAPSPSLSGSAPKLFPSEQGAFKALEAATQIDESRIVQKGCKAATYPFEVHTSYTESGNAVLGVAPYQSVLKKGYVKAKWWQQSRTWRENGVNAGTHWLKTRVTPAGCAIEVRLEGDGTPPADSIDGFNESGTIAIQGKTPAHIGPFKK